MQWRSETVMLLASLIDADSRFGVGSSFFGGKALKTISQPILWAAIEYIKRREDWLYLA